MQPLSYAALQARPLRPTLTDHFSNAMYRTPVRFWGGLGMLLGLVIVAVI